MDPTLNQTKNLEPVRCHQTKKTMTIEIPALGRPFSLGMLYDCCHDKLIPGITLWNHEALGENVASTPQDNTSFDFIASDTVSDKSSALDITASMKASFLSGLIEVGGSALYLNDTRTSKNQARVTLKYSRTTRFDQLSMNHVGVQNMTNHDVFDKGTATHVVTGILYGAQAFFIFDRELSKSENSQDIQGNLQVMIKKIPSLTIEGKGDLKMDDKEKEEVKKCSCKFHGDFALESNPVTYEDAIKIYTDLPKLLGERGEKAVPVKVWLYPLRKLDSQTDQLVRDISADLVFRTEKVIQEMIDVTIQCNDLMRHPAAEKFPDIKNNIIQLRELCDRFKLTFQKQLAQILPAIRDGGSEESALADFLISIQQSPFDSLHITQFFSSKQQEMDTVSSYLTVLPSIKVLPTETARNKLISDPLIDYVLCYNFTSLNEEPYLSDMCNWLQTAGHDVYKNKNISMWFKDKDVVKNARRCVRAFQEFADTNASSEETQFIISSITDQSNPGVSIYLYADGDLLSAKFEPPTKPNPPVISGRTHDSMELTLSPADFGKEFIVGYHVDYRSAEEENWSHFITKNKDQKITVTGLKPHRKYQFRYSAVCNPGLSAASSVTEGEITLPTSPPEAIQGTNVSAKCGDSGVNAPSDKIVDMTTNKTSSYSKCQHIKENMMLSKGTEKGKPSIYQLYTDSCESGYHKYSLGKENIQIPNKVILLVGATGTGKTTLINGMANYILGVEWKDDFRFKLVHEVTNKSEAHSQTSLVTAYKMNHESDYQIEYSLTLIDTPGFGDTRGIAQDKKITEDIHTFFTAGGGIDQIDAVCFVVQASLARLTHTQKYIFNSIFSIFGKDIRDNILMLINFSDGERPPVLEAIKAADVPCPVDSEDDPVHFKFNNSALFANNQSDMSVNDWLWKMGAHSMKTFFSDLSKIETKSLTLTKEVLKERKKLQIMLQALQPQIKTGLMKLDEIRKTQDVLQHKKDRMAANEDFEYEVTTTDPVQEVITHGFITNCQKCHFTCHYPCQIADDKEKYNCAAMCNNYCTVCPGKCIWNVHYNQKYKWDYVTKTEKRTYEELKKNYEAASGEVMTAEKVFIQLNKEYSTVKQAVFDLIKKSSQSLKRLREIALIPNPLSTTEYIDLMIQNEEHEVKPGYQERIQSLMEVRQTAEILEKIQKGEELLPGEQGTMPK
ncbi:uncharacterized protein LOC135057170 [Pseudophryne corroboree]|uniref:uncharacterized protein LOC135057170 n=1 Tax=Pseudophryne corroboree TaxID=495146 RepID=UPI0030813973